MNVFKAVHEGLQLKYPRARTNLVIYIYIESPSMLYGRRSCDFVRAMYSHSDQPKTLCGHPSAPFSYLSLIDQVFCDCPGASCLVASSGPTAFVRSDVGPRSTAVEESGQSLTGQVERLTVTIRCSTWDKRLLRMLLPSSRVLACFDRPEDQRGEWHRDG